VTDDELYAAIRKMVLNEAYRREQGKNVCPECGRVTINPEILLDVVEVVASITAGLVAAVNVSQEERIRIHIPDDITGTVGRKNADGTPIH